MSWQSVATDVAVCHGLTLAELRGPSCVRKLSRARQAAYAALKAEGYSTTQIGRWLGGRDHSTVVSGIKAHLARVEQQERGR
jgi:chromosomal replication initiator protein